MSIGKTISIKIFNYNETVDNFINTVEKINNSNHLCLKECPLDYVWGFQDDVNDLRINLYQSKRKVEFVIIYNEYNEVQKYLDMIKTFLNISKIDFKAIALSFGRVYYDFPSVNFKFIKPEFVNEKELMYKQYTDINYSEDDDGVYLSTKFHFYKFDRFLKKPLDVIKKEILDDFEKYHNKFEKMVEVK